jgi:predicted esterase
MRRTPLHGTHADLPTLVFPGTAPHSRSAIIWLHGIGERGTVLSDVANYGLPAALAAGRAVATCDVLCPQLAAKAQWTSALVHHTVLSANLRYDVVVLMGYSLGGLGVLEAVAELGGVCSLHIAIASGKPRLPTANQAGVRLIAVQGEHDRHPEVSRFVAEVRQRGGVAEEVIVVAGDHYISESALWQPELQAALAFHGLGLSNKLITP